jgi:hypothetical protein
LGDPDDVMHASAIFFGAGRYVDRVRRDSGCRKFASKTVVLDNRQIDTLLAISIKHSVRRQGIRLALLANGGNLEIRKRCKAGIWAMEANPRLDLADIPTRILLLVAMRLFPRFGACS